MQHKSQINPAILQPLFESASNVGDKGQAQYFTPLPWGRAFALALPRYRPVVADLHCGAGDLLAAAVRPSTTDLLGCDIDPGPFPTQPPNLNRVTADANQFYPLLRAVDFTADCFTLNPPWDLHQFRAPLARLADSELATVRAAFAAQDGRTPADCIDSTVAALCIALDLCSLRGEGFLIGNDATLQRLIFDANAPHRSLAVHVWARLTIPGNICVLADGHHANPLYQVNTGVIWFARDHDKGLHQAYRCLRTATGADAEAACNEFQKRRLDFREGAEIKSYGYVDETRDPWLAAVGEWQRTSRKDSPQWNIWLRPDGSIATDLTGYDVKSGRVSKAEAEALHSLNGQQPMQLVMQRTRRTYLERAILGTGWRVDPVLQDALKAAVEEYHSVRAPIVPLTPIQRLGFLDERDAIVCRRELDDSFDADCTYKLRSSSVAVKRKGQKANLTGGYDDCEWDGQELAFFITDRRGVERIFMEKRLKSKSIRVSILKPGEKPGQQRDDTLVTCAIDFTLNDLIEHFIIPDVPDVATLNPAAYPVYDNPAAAAIAARIQTRTAEMEALEGALKTDKAELKQTVGLFYFHTNHGKTAAPSSISVPCVVGEGDQAEKREVLVCFQNRYGKIESEDVLVRALGEERATAYFRSQDTLTIDCDQLPVDDAQEFVDELQNLVTRYNASAALSIKQAIKPVADFHARRHTLLTVEENMALEEVAPITAMIKTKGRGES